jgi:3-hydroxyisobutyrate dehydrogenase
MALGLKAGVDVDLMIKAIATGSGGSTQFGIRAPWMAQPRKARCPDCSTTST